MKKKKWDQYISLKVPVANPEDTAGDILKRCKHSDWEEVSYVFVTDTEKRLKGYFPFHRLLQSQEHEKVASLMQPCHAVSQKHSLEYVATHAIQKNITAVPVTDEQGVFLGIIPPQVIIETLRKEHIEDLHKMAGIKKETIHARKAIDAPPLRNVRHRLPWLLIGLTGSFISTYLMAGYEQTLKSYIALSFFVPGIVYLADAIGTQTETLVIRSLSLTKVSISRMLYTELRTGMLLGMILGVLSMPLAMLITRDLSIALVVSGAIISAGILATSIGLVLPWLLQRLGVDPAFGSGPLATIIQDILSIFIYLMIATSVLG